ncbi:MAG: hypothetical protein EBR82_39685 [Caulobacteraceae bacterium]|jgi:hypothetical protein|nr:hypothetical protein [Caulobacteraceae bacterium]
MSTNIATPPPSSSTIWMTMGSPRPAHRWDSILSTYHSSRAIKPNGTISFNDYLEGIRDGRWRKDVEKIRNAKDPKAEKNYQADKRLLSITICGLFPNEEKMRTPLMLLKYSGIVAIDIDEFKPETGEGNLPEALEKVPDILRSMPECLAFHKSIRGNGYAAFFAGGKVEEHSVFYELYRQELESKGIRVDSAPQQVNAYRFISWDDDAYINRTPLIRRIPMGSPPPSPPIVKEIEIEHPPQLGNKWGEGWDVNKPEGRYNEEEGDEAFSLLLSYGWKHLTTRSDGIRILQRPFKGNGESGGSATWGFKKNLFYVFSSNAAPFVANKAYPPFQVLTMLKYQGDWKAAKDELRQRYGMASAKKGRPKTGGEQERQGEDFSGLRPGRNSSPENRLQGIELDVCEFILSHFALRFNTRTNRLEVDGERLKDMDEKNICLITSSSLALGAKGRAIAKEILGSHFIPKYDPFEDFFAKHKDEPREPTLEDLINTLSITSDDIEFSKLLVRKWLLGIIASMKGVHSTLCLVLIGKQGLGKTNFFRYLLPDELREYYAEHTLSEANEKDNDIVMSEKLLILDDEFAGKGKKEYEKLKANLSKDTFTIRRAYGKHHEELRRLAVLCGTSNEMAILHDPTGNRRILPIEIKGMDAEAFAALNKNHLFIELLELYEKDPSAFFLTGPEIERLNKITEVNEARTIEHEALLKYFLTPAEMEDYKDGRLDMSPSLKPRFFTAFDIKEYLEFVTKSKPLNLSIVNIGKALTRIGFEKIREKPTLPQAGKDNRRFGYILICRYGHDFQGNRIS